MLSENLVDDIIVSILCRLPAKSLVRFKSVSKPWCQLIESPQFITEHSQTRAAITNNGCLLIKLERRSHFSLVYDRSQPWRGLEHLHRYKDSNFIVAECNGIFCVFSDRYTVQLWNPAIRQCKTLPRSLIADLKQPENFSYDPNSILGLTFDPKCKRYEVVRIWVFSSCLYTPGGPGPKWIDNYMNKVEVWTPGNNSWRQIDTVPHVPLADFDDPVNLKGRCYWLAGYLKSNVVVSFDMVLEVFQVTPVPESLGVAPIQFLRYMKLAILNETVAVFSYPLKHNPRCFEVWLLNESDQVSVSWSKYMTVEMPPSPSVVPRKFKNRERKPEAKMFPLGFWNKEELILHDEYGRLVLLNTSTGETVYNGLCINVVHRVYVYNESLVSINEWS